MRSPQTCLRLAAPWLLAATAFGCASAPADKTPIQTGPVELGRNEWRVTDHVLVYTDGSGTMWAHETFPDAKALTRSFVDALPSANAPAARSGGYSAGVVGFGGDERIQAPLAPLDRPRLAATAASLTVLGDVSGTGGTTPYAAVLTEARQQLEGKRGRAAVVFFSDGVPDDENAALWTAQQLIESHPDGVCFHGVHTGSDPEGYAFLQRLTALTSCGSVRPASSIGTAYEVQQLAKAVTVGPAGLPAVAAAPCDSVVRLRGIEFEFARAEIRPESQPVLEVAVEQLTRCPDLSVTITGHTCTIGSEAYNDSLSFRRAEATKRFLIERGIAPGRLEAEGRGWNDPIAPNDTAQGRAQNRRVELTPAR
jgi:OOP family OmpA-OmpF porin